MYLLTIRDGLQTRHFGPYESPRQASDDLELLQRQGNEKVTWQIHRLEPPAALRAGLPEIPSAEPLAV